MISHIRTNILGNIMRTVHSGIAAGVVHAGSPRRRIGLARPEAGTGEFGVLDQFGEHALDMQMLVDIGRFAIAKPSPIMNSALARFFVENWCMICGMMPVRL